MAPPGSSLQPQRPQRPQLLSLGLLRLLAVAALLATLATVQVRGTMTGGKFCPHGRLHCTGTSRCILEDNLCDSVSDCNGDPDVPDGQDEDCMACSAGAFQCREGCLPASQRCNGFRDCEDGEDEEGCPEKLDLFACWPQDNGTNDTSTGGNWTWTGPTHINKIAVCDGVTDCCAGADAECEPADEQNCSSGCAPGAYMYEGLCYRNTLVCDGVHDYLWDEDEERCLKCRVGEYDVTFSISRRCDGNKDCDDGQDERNCSPCMEGLMECKSLLICMEPKEWCNGKCPGEDKECYPTFYGFHYQEVALICLSVLLGMFAVLLLILLWVCQYRRLMTAVKTKFQPSLKTADVAWIEKGFPNSVDTKSFSSVNLKSEMMTRYVSKS